MTVQSKGNKQRKGQWLINQIIESFSDLQNSQEIYSIIWNMPSDEFDKIMRKYYE